MSSCATWRSPSYDSERTPQPPAGTAGDAAAAGQLRADARRLVLEGRAPPPQFWPCDGDPASVLPVHAVRHFGIGAYPLLHLLRHVRVGHAVAYPEARRSEE